MQATPAIKRPAESDSSSGEHTADNEQSNDHNGEQSSRNKRRKQAAPTRAAPITPPPQNDLQAKMADIYKNALAFSAELALPPFDPLAAYRLLPRTHEPPRIFNPEAYCDLCCKEFCNKYFLKTHRANKHGIYDSPEDIRIKPRMSSSPNGMERRISDDDIGLGTTRRLSPDSCLRARESNFQPDVLRRLGVVDIEAFCEICCKEYCNKYFLKSHRVRKHGAPPDSPPPVPLVRTPPTQVETNRTSLENSRTPLETCRTPLESSRTPVEPCRTPLERCITPIETSISPEDTLIPPTLLPMPQPAMKLESNDEDFGEEDSINSRDQTSPLNLKLEERGGSPASASEELRKLQTMISQLNELTAVRLADSENGIPRDSRPSSSSPPTPDDSRRSNSGSSFCEICNKELCNKYFMRTHMQRMHGISLDGGAQLGGVTCDICHKELCSKYFLRVHKHNTHGIPLTSNPQQPNPVNLPTEPCPLCSKRFRGSKALRAHLLTDHAPPSSAVSTAQPSTDAPLELLAPDKQYTCSYCPFSTSVLAFLFAHERAHANDQLGSGTGSEDEGFSCSRCEFRSVEFSAMEAHLRSAHGGALLAVPAGRGGATMQPFVLEEQGGGGFVPSLVFLPVRRRATRRATVTFTLTPA